MAETSKNKIYYNDNENSVADVLADMKKMAESTDKAIENSKYNDEAIKKNISDIEEKQSIKDSEQDSKIVELQTEKSKLETELKEMQEDFYQNSIRGQASGEYIHVEDSSNCRAKIGISGNSEQETRSGKNLLNFNGFATKEISGVTITNNNDGSITLNGTATATISIRLSNQMNKTLTAGNYYFSSNSKGSVSGAFTTFMFGNNDAEDIKFATITEENKGFSTSIDYKKYWLWLYINSGITFTNYIMKPQLEAGTVKTNWELYGAMPSLDYLSEIVTVGQNVNELANLIQTQIINGVEITKNNDGSLTFNGTATSGITINLNNESGKYFNAISGSSYTISLQNNSGLYFRLRKVSENTNIATFDSPSKGITFTSNYTGECFAYLVIIKDTTFDNLTIYPKLEKGSKVTPYSKYGQGCVKVTKCNKNLFDKDNITLNEKSYNLDNNGKLIYQGSWRVVNYIKVKPNTTYTLSGVMIPNNWTHRISEYDAQLVHIKQNQKTFDGFHTFTTSSTTKYIRFNLIYDNNGFDYDLSSIQLEENKKKTTLEQHEEKSYIMPIQQPMRSIGDIRDTFIKKDGKWYERHYINRKILDGTENIRITTNGNSFAFDLTDILSNTKQEETSPLMSNMYKAVSWIHRNVWTDKYSIAQFGKSVGFDKENYTTVDEFKAYLKTQYDAGTPVYVDYLLETPIDIECTEEQSQILEELNNARTYKNVTNITTDSKAILSLDYAKDLETLLNNTQALAVNNASEGV